MKKLLIVLLVSLVSFSIQAKPKKQPKIVQTLLFEEWTYTQDPFTASFTSDTEALITSPVSDGSQAPLPFRVIKGEMSTHEFKETLTFITDNLSEAYNN